MAEKLPLDLLVEFMDLAQMGCQGRREFSDHQKERYFELRKFFFSVPRYKEVLPSMILESSSLVGFNHAANEYMDADARRHELDVAFGQLRLEVLGGEATADPVSSIDASAWTGLAGRAQRVQQVRTMLPVAINAIENLIDSLGNLGGNGGPLLDHRCEALEDLRELHRILGEILDAADDDSLYDDFGQGLPAEAARYAIRAAHALRDDPIPYSVSAMILAIFSALGFTEAGAWVSAVAVTFTKSSNGNPS